MNIISGADPEGLRGWDRTSLSTAPLLWDYFAGSTVVGLTSKSTTTWFLGGRG
jgi:hypothetical protein